MRSAFGIVALVKLGTAYERDMVADKFVVEVTVSKGSAVGGNEESCIIKMRDEGLPSFEKNRFTLKDKQ